MFGFRSRQQEATKSNASIGPNQALTDDQLDALGQLEAINRSQAVIEFEPDGTILTANDNFLAAVGYSLEEIRGQHHRIFVEPAYAQSPEYREFWQKLGRGEFDSGEYMRVAKGGREIWIQASYNPVFDDHGKQIKVVKYASDITEAKLTSVNHLGQIEAINKSQAVIEFELDGTILTANRNFTDTVGYSLSEIQGKHHRMFVEPEYAASTEYAAFWEKLRHGEFDAGEYKRVGRGGKEIWIQASYNPILDAKGKPYKVVKFATDVTKQAMARQMTQDVATSTEEMTTTVKEISVSVNQAAELARSAETLIAQTTDHVNDLNVRSNEIGSVVEVIRDLAEQTNLLALNATIEAARAGDSGRSFAVVAQEVKDLAKQTSDSTGNIEGSVQSIQESIEKVVSANGSISQSVSEVSGNANTIAAAVEEQSVTMSRISEMSSELKTLI
ncbi:MAG: PAS domain-containing methyl-accepting chemotaxis protein [Planctomycetota bacterium]